MAIIVCPLSHARALARARRPSRTISLLDPGTMFPEFDDLHETHSLKLPVHDIESAMDGWDAPSAAHIAQMLAFIQAWDREAPLLVHCFMGISRSTATAFIAACAHNPEANETDIAVALRDASPTASPNRRFVALADVALAREGRMVSAIDSIGRGPPWHETGAAAPFEIASRYSKPA